MDSASLSSLLKRLCKVMWEANVTNPITYVTQISFLIFLKMLEEMEAERGGENPIFKKVTLDAQEVDFSRLRWSTLTSDPDNDRMLRMLRDLLPRLTFHPDLSIAARALFEDAAIVIPDGATLRRSVDIISPIHFLSEDADVKGDLFEILVNDLGSQKKAAQFRTPRHLIRVIVEMVNPQIGETMCDSAGGTGGFAIAVYEHILLANTSPQFVREVPAPYGQTVKRGLGDRLTPAQWEFLQKGTIHLFEGDKDIIRMAAMNAVLHGFDHSPIVRRDGIGGSEDKWDEVQFDCIVENPPFSGASQSPKRSLRVGKGDKYVLFLAAALRSLRQGGRCGIVLPNGILSGDTNSHIEVKKRLLAEFDLQAVIMLPKGMFEPYTPNPTCVLVFKKTERPTENVWFYNVGGDGSSLKKARKFGPKYRNDFPDLLAKWRSRATEKGRAWLVPLEKIIANGYNMSLTSLGLVETEKVEHSDPEDILESIVRKQKRSLKILEETRRLVGAWRQEYRQLLESAPTRPLGKCGKVLGGGTPAKDNASFWSGNIPWITAKEMWKPEIHDSQLKISEEALEASAAKLIPANSVLFVVRGSILFKRVPVSINRVPCTINQDMKAIVPHDDILADYLAHMMWGSNEELRGLVDTAGNSAGKLETDKWSAVQIPVPESKDEQRRIIARLDVLITKHAELRRLQSETEAELAAFTPALLAKAFRGEL